MNPTLEDNFPTTNLEALACGTFVVTFNTGGSVESIDCRTGKIVRKKNMKELVEAIISIYDTEKETVHLLCKERVDNLFNKEYKFKEYLKLYYGMNL